MGFNKKYIVLPSVIFSLTSLGILSNAFAQGASLPELEQISQLLQHSKDSATKSVCGLNAKARESFEIEFQQVWQETISAQQKSLAAKSAKEKYFTVREWSRCISSKQCRIYSFILEEDLHLGPKALKLKESIDRSAAETGSKDIASHLKQLKTACNSQTFKKLTQSPQK